MTCLPFICLFVSFAVCVLLFRLFFRFSLLCRIYSRCFSSIQPKYWPQKICIINKCWRKENEKEWVQKERKKIWLLAETLNQKFKQYKIFKKYDGIIKGPAETEFPRSRYPNNEVQDFVQSPEISWLRCHLESIIPPAFRISLFFAHTFLSHGLHLANAKSQIGNLAQWDNVYIRVGMYVYKTPSFWPLLASKLFKVFH